MEESDLLRFYSLYARVLSSFVGTLSGCASGMAEILSSGLVDGFPF